MENRKTLTVKRVFASEENKFRKTPKGNFVVVGFADVVGRLILEDGSPADLYTGDWKIVTRTVGAGLIVFSSDKIRKFIKNGVEIIITPKVAGGDFDENYDLTPAGRTLQYAVSQAVLPLFTKEFPAIAAKCRMEHDFSKTALKWNEKYEGSSAPKVIDETKPSEAKPNTANNSPLEDL
jgi:hypothetical protein